MTVEALILINFSCRMVDQRKAISLISRRKHCQRFSPLKIFKTPQTRIEPAQTEFRHCWMKLCSCVNHYTPKPQIGSSITFLQDMQLTAFFL